ncbi:LysR family transcriptional regulator [Gulosibacter chungangensis]|nr:LysR family transcriptional regulator [Gulosibacter chungangensis]
MANLTLRQLEYIISVAELGSVTAASKQLHVAQSAISASIADLERTIGIQIFIRHARGLSPTREGHEILDESRKILLGAEGLEQYAADRSEVLSGSLIVGCYTTLASPILPPSLAAFATKHPQVHVDFTVGHSDQIIEQVQHGECDLAILYDFLREGSFTELNLQSTPLTRSRPYVLLHSEHPLASAHVIDLADLVDDPFILFDLAPGAEYFLSLFASEGVEPRIQYRSRDFELVRGLVARGLGYSILSQRTVIGESYEGLPLTMVDLSAQHKGLEVISLTPDTRLPSRRAQAFISECRGVLARP